MDIQEILRHFGGVKSAGASQYRANCPACGDTKGPLYIAAAPDGKILIDCKKGCSFEDVLASAGLNPSDCFKENPVRPDPWTLLREHVYTDISGNVLAKKQIYDTGGGKKQAVWYRLEKGRYLKGLGGAKMPLYHLDRLTRSGGTAVITEGEKDAENVERLGFAATTSPNGAGQKWRREWNEFFRGKMWSSLRTTTKREKNTARTRLPRCAVLRLPSSLSGRWTFTRRSSKRGIFPISPPSLETRKQSVCLSRR